MKKKTVIAISVAITGVASLIASVLGFIIVSILQNRGIL